MCGLIGVISKKDFPHFDEVYLQPINAALDKMSYRGPDNKGVWNENGVCFGHRRLSIIDLSTDGNQPFRYSDGRYVIVFNGEIYNFQELKEDLIELGHSFHTQTDTEVIIAAYKQYGKSFCNFLRGMFALVLYDLSDNKIIFSRDRLGKKPLFIFENEEVLIFSSEIKFFHAFNVPLDIDEESLLNFLSLQYIPGPKTIYKQVRQIQPAELFTYNRGKNEHESDFYWSMFNYNGSVATAPDIEEIDSLLMESIKYRLVANVDVGLLLSGGIDSSLLATYMQELGGKKVKAFNVGFSDKLLDESAYATKVADALDLELITLNVEDISEDNFIESIFHADQPLGDSAIIPTYLIAKSIGQHVKVVLSGEGADELFHGYDHYRYEKHYYRMGNFPFQSVGLLMDMLPTRNYRFERLKNKLRSINSFKTDIGSSRWTSILSPELAKRYTSPTCNISETYEDIFGRHFTNFRKNAGKLESSLMLDLLTWLPDDLLIKTDRMMMAYSVEARTPFLDHKLVERVLSSSGQFGENLFQNKNYLRQLLKNRLPASVSELISNRPKQGFETPKAKWLMTNLHAHATFLFSESNLKLNSHLNSVEILNLWNNFKKQVPGTNTRLVWNVFCFLEWYRQHENKFGFKR